MDCVRFTKLLLLLQLLLVELVASGKEKKKKGFQAEGLFLKTSEAQ